MFSLECKKEEPSNEKTLFFIGWLLFDVFQKVTLTNQVNATSAFITLLRSCLAIDG